MRAKLIEVQIEQDQSGWYIATSDDLPGLFIAHPDEDTVRADIALTIEALFRADHGLDVKVVEGESVSGKCGAPWVAIPPELASRELASA